MNKIELKRILNYAKIRGMMSCNVSNDYESQDNKR